MRSVAIAALIGASYGCHQGLDRVRYENAPIVTAVNDRAPTPEPPDERFISNRLYHFDSLFHDRIVDAAKLRGHQLALDINALGEVPDSSWFTNRIGVREVSVEELRRGPLRGPGPMERKPWSIVRSKSVGVAPGFIIEDTAGDRYILKFDDPDYPEAESGAHIIVHRLVWALGYNVPEDRLVRFRPEDLRIAEGAVVADIISNERPMTQRYVESVLAQAHKSPDGTFRALVSEMVPGKPLGGFAATGTRPDDPNDTIPHQHRRVLRGLFPIIAWLQHTDFKPENTLDAWVTGGDPERHYVRHYLIDFGKALGVLGRQSHLRADGFARLIDIPQIGRSAVTAGLYPRAWDGLEAPNYRGLGIYQVGRYDPATFKARTIWQPFVEADAADMFWGARLMMRLTPAHIRAAVEEAQFSDRRTVEYLTQALIARQRKTAAHWFTRTNPLDRFTASGSGGGRGEIDVCFDDLLRHYRLAPEPLLAASRYAVAVYDYRGERLPYDGRMTIGERTGRLCIRGAPTANRRRDRYTIIAIDTVRPRVDTEPVLVHVALAPQTGEPRIIGIRRLD